MKTPTEETLKELDDQILRDIVNTISTMTDAIKSNQDLIKELIVKEKYGKMKIPQTKISRQQAMDRYDWSRSTVRKFEIQGKLKRYYYDEARRKPYYDIREIENLFQSITS